VNSGRPIIVCYSLTSYLWGKSIDKDGDDFRGVAIIADASKIVAHTYLGVLMTFNAMNGDII
jgi:hypothetical protein